MIGRSSARKHPYSSVVEINEKAVVRAWRRAAEDLGISVETGGSLVDEQGHSHRYVVHVADFGSVNGTICSLIRPADSEDNSAIRDLAQEAGFFWSALGESYTAYTRDLFIATLDDWRWFGAAPPPSWYSGTPWGH
jgi:hypothetical protein